jgi:hypothetical protein
MLHSGAPFDGVKVATAEEAYDEQCQPPSRMAFNTPRRLGAAVVLVIRRPPNMKGMYFAGHRSRQ